jgi:hypothetical protein
MPELRNAFTAFIRIPEMVKYLGRSPDERNNIVAYLLQARTVEAEKLLLLCRGCVTISDAYSRCYGAIW